MKLNKENKRGISLIVLVITIIVMIILAAAIILSLNSSGIIGKANKAKLSADKANMLEAANVAYAEYQLEKQMGELEDPTQTAEAYVKEKLGNQFTADTLNQLSVLDDGTIQALPIIPKGFVVSPYAGEQKISEGLVIYEADSLENVEQATAMETYNQYVWVPVPDMSEFKTINWKNVSDFEEDYAEPVRVGITHITIDNIDDHADEISQYNSMRASVEKNEGFYIARYEAGIPKGKTTSSVKIDGTDKPVSKKNANVWNKIAWDITFDYDYNAGTILSSIAYGDDSQNGCAKIAKLLVSSESNVSSHLIYGVQWDAVMTFMKDVDNPNSTTGKKYIEDNTGMGWFKNNYSVGNPDHKTGIDVDSKASNMVKNIYDMAGNVSEWTYEVFYNSPVGARLPRGSAYVGKEFNGNTISRGGATFPGTNSRSDIGFRVALYIK